MILIYSQLPFDKSRIDNQRDILKKRYSIFFVDNDSFLYSTECNLNLLKDVIINHQISKVHSNSIKEINFTVSELSELITFSIQNGNNGKGSGFWFENEKLHFNKNNINDVQSTISNHLNSNQSTNLIITIHLYCLLYNILLKNHRYPKNIS